MNMVLGILLVIGMLWLAARWFGGTTEKERHRHTAKTTVPTGVLCPTCQSPAVIRVTAGERVTSGIVGGLLFSRKARAHFQCGACSFTW